jgi:hypothetical protein
MIFAGLMALSVGVITGRIVLAKASVEEFQPIEVSPVVAPTLTSNADERAQSSAPKPEPVDRDPPARKAEASSSQPSASLPAAESTPPIRKAEAPSTQVPARAAVAQDAPSTDAPKRLDPRLAHDKHDDDDDDDDPC